MFYMDMVERKPVVPAAVDAGCSPATVVRYVRAGRLECEWDRGRRLVSVERLRELLREPPRARALAASGLP